MRILLLGEYSNVHATLAKALRALGHEVLVVSNGDFWKDYPRDIDLSRKGGRYDGIKYLLKTYSLLPRLRGYDVVQIINPMFLELKAERIFPIYKYLRRHNKRMVLGAFGMDYYWVSTCCDKKPLRYSDFNFGNQLRTNADAIAMRADWLGTSKERLNHMIATDCDAIVSGLYEYDVCYRMHFPYKTTHIPFPIELKKSAQASYRQGDKLRLFIGVNTARSAYKGTDIMLQAAEDAARRWPDKIELKVARSVPFDTYRQMMEGSDAILDQLYSYTPSMNPLEAMSKGIICIGGGEPEAYDLIGEHELRPIINVLPNYDSVYHAIEQLALHPKRIAVLQQQSIEYIHRHHDSVKVANQYLDLWNSIAPTT